MSGFDVAEKCGFGPLLALFFQAVRADILCVTSRLASPNFFSALASASCSDFTRFSMACK